MSNDQHSSEHSDPISSRSQKTSSSGLKGYFMSVSNITRRCFPACQKIDLVDENSTESHPSPTEDPPINSKMKSDSRFISTGFTLIGYTFLLQLGLHLMTFLLNGFAYRRLDALSIGLVNVRIGLFYTTFMFITRDALRRASLSRGGELVASRHAAESSNSAMKNESSQDDSHCSTNTLAGLIDLAWTILPLGLVIDVLLLFIWLWILPSPGALVAAYAETNISTSLLQRRYVHCLLVYAISGLFELATEPFWLICQLSHLVRERIFIEAMANTARAMGIIVAIFMVDPNYAIYSLAVPQLLHGTTLFFGYLLFFYKFWDPFGGGSQVQLEGIRTFRDLFPRGREFAIDQRALTLAKNLFAQGLLKQLLSEGERYLISGFHLLSFADQGIYDLVNNIGSTATRLLFLPMEESCHFVFNQCLNRELSPIEQDPILMKNVFRMFRTVLHTCSLIAWIGLTFAQANSRLLLLIYAGPTLANNPTAYGLLRCYAAYVLLLAWNGSTEAFLNAAMSPIQVAKHNERLITFSVIFLGANWFFVPWIGAYGFVVANSINMLCRIFYSCSFAHEFTRTLRSGLRQRPSTSTINDPSCGFSLIQLMLPSAYEALVLASSLLVTLVSESYLCCDLSFVRTAGHTLTTVVFLLLSLFVIYREERDLTQVLRTELFHIKTI